MEGTFFQLRHRLTEPERLFDLAQGIHARRRRLKRRPGRCIPFTRWNRRLLWYGLSMLLVDALCAPVLILAEDTLWLWLLGICAALELFLYLLLRSNYRRVLRLFQETTGPENVLTLDAQGIREENEKAPPVELNWEDWDCCIANSQVIVLLFKPPVNLLILLPYSEEALLTLRLALRAFGREDTLYQRS